MEKNEFKEFDQNINIRRRDLLPWWIKFFCLLFLFAGVLAIIRIVLSYFNVHSYFEFYGLDANSSFFNSFIVFIVFVLHGLTAYGLWCEKSYGITLAKINALLGIIICIYSMLMSYYSGNITFRLEIILLFLFLIKIIKIKAKWDNIPN